MTCDTMFMTVLCNVDALAVSNTSYSSGSGPLLLECNGTESSILECVFDSGTSFCSHLRVAGVQCRCKYLTVYLQ